MMRGKGGIMEQSTNEAISSFDLWREPWIQVESADTALRGKHPGSFTSGSYYSDNL